VLPLVLLLRPMPAICRMGLLFWGVHSLAWFFVSQQSRLLLPVHVVLALLCGGAACAVMSRFRPAFMMLMALALFDLGLRNVREGWEGWRVIAGMKSRWDHVLSKAPDFALWRTSGIVRPDDRVYLYNDPRALYVPCAWRAGTFWNDVRWSTFRDPDDARRHVQSTGATLFHLNRYRSDYIDRAGTDRFLERHARLLAHRNGVYLFDLTGTRGIPYLACEPLTGRVTVRASSEAYPAAGAVDGRDHRRDFDGDHAGWMSARAPTPEEPEWLELTFEKAEGVSGLWIVSYPDPTQTLNSFQVRCFKGGGHWDTLTVALSDRETEWFHPMDGQAVERIRITVTRAPGAARILEVRAGLVEKAR
jgi:hypothetical protein